MGKIVMSEFVLVMLPVKVVSFMVCLPGAWCRWDAACSLAVGLVGRL